MKKILNGTEFKFLLVAVTWRIDITDIKSMVWKASRVAQSWEEKYNEIMKVKNKMLFYIHAYQMIYTCISIYMCIYTDICINIYIYICLYIPVYRRIENQFNHFIWSQRCTRTFQIEALTNNIFKLKENFPKLRKDSYRLTESNLCFRDHQKWPWLGVKFWIEKIQE